MQFKKVDVLISENLTKAQLKEKVLTELNKISKESNPSISYIANIHDIVNGKYWICMDSETKETMGATDELIDLQAIFRHTTENSDEASRDLLYSSKYIEDNFLRKIIFETYKEANDSRLNKLETTVGTNEKDIEDKHYKLERRVTTTENTIADNKELEDTRYNEYTQFKKNTENNILSINNTLNTKANLGGSETQVFNVADPTSDWHAINLAYAKKNFNADLINTHKTDFNNPHKTSITNLIDTSIVDPANNHILQYDSNTRKWKNAVLSVDLSNYYNKSEVDSKLDTKANTNNVYNKSEIDAKLQDVSTQADNRYLPITTIVPQILTESIEKTVGVSGDFETLWEGIQYCTRYIPTNGAYFTLKLKSGFVWNENISIINTNISFIRIISEDTEVMVGASISGILFLLDNSRGPAWEILLNGNGCAITKVFDVGRNSNIVIGSGKGAYNFDCVAAIYLWGNSQCQALGSKWGNLRATGSAVHVDGNSNINLISTKFLDTPNLCVNLISGTAFVKNVTFTNCGNTKFNIPTNQVTANGILFADGE
ncbi:hypothetical protein ACNGMK_09160 [Campylobacter coli]